MPLQRRLIIGLEIMFVLVNKTKCQVKKPDTWLNRLLFCNDILVSGNGVTNVMSKVHKTENYSLDYVFKRFLSGNRYGYRCRIPWHGAYLQQVPYDACE